MSGKRGMTGCWKRTPKHNLSNKLSKQGQIGYGPGSKNGCAKLKEEDVLKIRTMGSMSWQSLSDIFGVSKTQIGRILKRQAWYHI